MAPTSVAEAVRPQQAVAELLFQPYRLGPFTLPNRIVMAPLTRSRARQPGNVPTSLNACYYAQRASAAFIISEATQVSMQGQGYAWTPGIHSREQIEGWRLGPQKSPPFATGPSQGRRNAPRQLGRPQASIVAPGVVCSDRHTVPSMVRVAGLFLAFPQP